MNPTHEKLVADSIAEKRTYTYGGFRPYGAADLMIMDTCVDESFDGNVPEEIVRNGGSWDAKKRVLWMPGKRDYASFVEDVKKETVSPSPYKLRVIGGETLFYSDVKAAIAAQQMAQNSGKLALLFGFDEVTGDYTLAL